MRMQLETDRNLMSDRYSRLDRQMLQECKFYETMAFFLNADVTL